MYDKQYKNEIKRISPSQDLVNSTKAAMLAQMSIRTDTNSPEKLNHKENPNMKKTTFRRFGAVAAAFIAVLALATTAFATWHFMRPSQVAEMAGNTALSAAFESNSAININQSVTSDNHVFTLLAVVSGEDISDHPIYNSTGEILRDRTYAILAVQNADGSPMPTPMDADFQPFAVSPFVRGESPLRINAFTMDSGGISMVVDGVMYIIADFTNVTMFANRGVYLGVNSGMMMSDIMNAFNFDEQTGAITANSYFEGINAIFTLPLDASHADPESARQFLDNLFGGDSR